MQKVLQERRKGAKETGRKAEEKRNNRNGENRETGTGGADVRIVKKQAGERIGTPIYEKAHFKKKQRNRQARRFVKGEQACFAKQARGKQRREKESKHGALTAGAAN